MGWLFSPDGKPLPGIEKHCLASFTEDGSHLPATKGELNSMMIFIGALASIAEQKHDAQAAIIRDLEKEIADLKDDELASLERRASRHADHLAALERRTKALERP
jgi:hypothetical protein